MGINAQTYYTMLDAWEKRWPINTLVKPQTFIMLNYANCWISPLKCEVTFCNSYDFITPPICYTFIPLGSPIPPSSSEVSTPNSALPSPSLLNDTGLLVLVLHGGNLLDGSQDLSSKTSDINTFQSVFDGVIRAHFPIASGRVAIRLVSCPSTCFEAMALMSRLVWELRVRF